MAGMRRLSRILMIGGCALAITACANRPATPQVAGQATSSTTAIQLRTLEALWSAVNDHYFDETFGGVDWQAVRDEYLAQVEAGSTSETFAELMRAMLDKLPSGAASLQTRAERIEAESSDTSRYEGIGAFVSFRAEPEPRVVLLSVIRSSPAEKAGLDAHDSILAIDGVPVTEEEGQVVVGRIRGPAGSKVTLTVRSPGRAPRDVVVTRGSLSASDGLRGGVLGDGSIGYLLFPTISPQDLIDDVVTALQGFNEERELDGLILDLRIASAGGDWPLTEMLALFADGELGEIYTRQESNPIIIAGQNISNSQVVPLTVIVGPDTDGAPEIFAAAVQASGRARVVGMPTPGLVEVVEAFALPDGSRAFIATGSYRTPDGRDIGQDGIRPNVTVEADWDEVTLEDDLVRNAAVRALAPPR